MATRRDKLLYEMLGEESTITPSDLYNAEFRSVLVGGYDKGEVDDYLERVADVFEAMINQVRELKEQLDHQKHQLESVHDMETTLRNALVSSQRFGESLTEAAQRQADALIEEGRAAKAQAEREAAELPEALKREIGQLKAARDRLRDDIRAVLATHRTLLEDIPAAEETQSDGTPAEDDGAGNPPLEAASPEDVEEDAVS